MIHVWTKIQFDYQLYYYSTHHMHAAKIHNQHFRGFPRVPTVE